MGVINFSNATVKLKTANHSIAYVLAYLDTSTGGIYDYPNASGVVGAISKVDTQTTQNGDAVETTWSFSISSLLRSGNKLIYGSVDNGILIENIQYNVGDTGFFSIKAVVPGTL